VTLATLRVRRESLFGIATAHALNNAGLSWGARGLLAYLLHQPDNWQCELEEFVIEHGCTPKEEVWRIFKELGERGYIRKVTDRFGNIEYVAVEGRDEQTTALDIEGLAKVIKIYPAHRKPHGAPQAVALAQAWNECVADRDWPGSQFVLADLAKRKASHDWTKEEGRYVPSLHSYIERRMWTFPVAPDPPKDRRDFNSGGNGTLVL
jgi:hypothetical protein